MSSQTSFQHVAGLGEADLEMFIPRTHNQMEVQQLKLSVLERNFNAKHKVAALNHLLQPSYIKIDGTYTYPNDARNSKEDGPIVMNMDHHFLDFVMYVSRYPGLGAILPNVKVRHDWAFNISLRDQTKLFNPKYGQIGFNTTGKMLYLGRCQEETVWIAFAPEAFVLNEIKPLGAEKTHRASHVTRHQYLRFCLFMAHCFATLHMCGIYCNNPYADVSNGVNDVTNLL